MHVMEFFLSEVMETATGFDNGAVSVAGEGEKVAELSPGTIGRLVTWHHVFRAGPVLPSTTPTDPVEAPFPRGSDCGKNDDDGCTRRAIGARCASTRNRPGNS